MAYFASSRDQDGSIHIDFVPIVSVLVFLVTPTSTLSVLPPVDSLSVHPQNWGKSQAPDYFHKCLASLQHQILIENG
jgi:hypothetical protein